MLIGKCIWKASCSVPGTKAGDRVRVMSEKARMKKTIRWVVTDYLKVSFDMKISRISKIYPIK